MALTAGTQYSFNVPGSRRIARTGIVLDNSYPTGGYLITPALFGFQQLFFTAANGFTGVPVGCAGIAFDPATLRLRLLTSAGAEVANATSLLGTTVMMEGHGA